MISVTVTHSDLSGAGCLLPLQLWTLRVKCRGPSECTFARVLVDYHLRQSTGHFEFLVYRD